MKKMIRAVLAIVLLCHATLGMSSINSGFGVISCDQENFKETLEYNEVNTDDIKIGVISC